MIFSCDTSEGQQIIRRPPAVTQPPTRTHTNKTLNIPLHFSQDQNQMSTTTPIKSTLSQDVGIWN
jgi:hypothetical protein